MVAASHHQTRLGNLKLRRHHSSTQNWRAWFPLAWTGIVWVGCEHKRRRSEAFLTGYSFSHDEESPNQQASVQPERNILSPLGTTRPPVPGSLPSPHKRKRPDHLLAHGAPFDQVGAHLVAASRRIGNDNLALQRDRNPRLDDVFAEIPRRGRHISRQ